MKALMVPAAAALMSVFAVAPADAQTRPVRAGILEVFGNDPCPTNADGDEIIVCKRLDERERFRIPNNLRELRDTPENESRAVRVQSALEAGDSGIGSCSAVGVGGATGCLSQEINRARAERRQNNQEESDRPLP